MTDSNEIAQRAKSLASQVMNWRIVRATTRFLGANGAILAGGISYRALFSLTAALTVAASMFSMSLANESFKATFLDAADAMLPGLFTTSDSEGVVDPSTLSASSGTSLAGIIALAIALFTASSVIAYLSKAIRAMFGLADEPQKLYLAMTLRFVGLITLFFGVIVTAVLSSVSTFLRDATLRWLNISSDWVSAAFDVGSYLIPFIVDCGIFVIMVRIVAGVHAPRSDLLWGMVLMGIGSTGLRLGSSWVVGKVTGPILATATTLVTFILWINLLVTVMLWVCAWTANPPAPETDGTGGSTPSEAPNYATLTATPAEAQAPTDDSAPSEAHDRRTAPPS